jgi:hypothetical protein
VREASEDLGILLTDRVHQGPEDIWPRETRGARRWLAAILSTAGILGLVVCSTLYLIFTMWGITDLASCVTNSYRPWFDPDDFSSYDRPIMCGNGMSWFAVAAPLVGWLLSGATSLMLLLGSHKPRAFIPLAIILGAAFALWLVWSQHVLAGLNTFERIPM